VLARRVSLGQQVRQQLPAQTLPLAGWAGAQERDVQEGARLFEEGLLACQGARAARRAAQARAVSEQQRPGRAVSAGVWLAIGG
jgi:hypothetical protein